MNEIEAKDCFEKLILTRWTKWQPTELELSDWIRLLRGVEWDDVKFVTTQYIREYEKYAEPKLNRFYKLLQARPQQNNNKKKTEWPECTTFIQQESTGKFVDVVLNPPSTDPDLLSRAAENMRKRLCEVYGGVWKIYKETTRWNMCKLQKEIRKSIVSEVEPKQIKTDIEKQLDSFSKPVEQNRENLTDEQQLDKFCKPLPKESNL